MKERIQIILAAIVFIPSVIAFTFQKQDDTAKSKSPQEKVSGHEAQLALELEKARLELELSKRQIADEIRKRDSIDAERKINISIANKSVNDLQQANKAYKKSLGRLVYVVGRFNPDSVMKYYSEYLDPTEVQVDSTKKKIDYPEIEVPKPKKNFWKRLFGVTY